MLLEIIIHIHLFKKSCRVQHKCEHLSSPNMAVIGVGKSLAASEKETKSLAAPELCSSYLLLSLGYKRRDAFIQIYTSRKSCVEGCAYLQKYLKH